MLPRTPAATRAQSPAPLSSGAELGVAERAGRGVPEAEARPRGGPRGLREGRAVPSLPLRTAPRRVFRALPKFCEETTQGQPILDIFCCCKEGNCINHMSYKIHSTPWNAAEKPRWGAYINDKLGFEHGRVTLCKIQCFFQQFANFCTRSPIICTPPYFRGSVSLLYPGVLN